MTRKATKRKLSKARTITVPDASYQPPKAGQDGEYNMPGASPKSIRRAFFRPFNVRREGGDQE